MITVVCRWVSSLVSTLDRRPDRAGDPRNELEQVLSEASEQHRALIEQASHVIASQQQAEIRLNSKLTELEALDATARQALVMADAAEQAGDTDRAERYTRAAETIASQLLRVDQDIDGLSTLVMEASRAVDRTRDTIARDSQLLQERITRLAADLDEAERTELQPALRAAMSRLRSPVATDVATPAEVEERIRARTSAARAGSHLDPTTLERRIRDVERAAANLAAHDRLDQFRAELGLRGGPDEPPVEHRAG